VRRWELPALDGSVAGPVGAAARPDDAQVMARAIVRRAEQRARHVEEEARRRGEARGAEEAVQREGASLRQAALALAAAAANLEVRAHELSAGLERLLPEAAAALAERVVGRAIADPGALAVMVRDAVAAALPADRVTVRLSPGDLATLAHAEVDLGPQVRLEAAHRLSPGEFEVDTEEAFVLDGVRRRLERALALLSPSS
jgi:flagellar biosynthesis/type III secretory pathway protein FliH